MGILGHRMNWYVVDWADYYYAVPRVCDIVCACPPACTDPRAGGGVRTEYSITGGWRGWRREQQGGECTHGWGSRVVPSSSRTVRVTAGLSLFFGSFRGPSAAQRLGNARLPHEEGLWAGSRTRWEGFEARSRPEGGG